MSRKEVRAAIATYISDGNIDDLNQVLTSFAKRINFQINSKAGQQSRAAGVVFITDETEARIAVGGVDNAGVGHGWKRIDYTIDFQIFHHSMLRESEDVMDNFDALIDGVKDRLRAGGHRLGLPDGSIIWQAAEPSISVNYGEPVTNNGGATETWASVRFTVTQMIQA